MQLAQKVPGSVALAQFLEQEESQRQFTAELKSILEVSAKTGKYWHDWSQLKILLSFRLKQVLKELQESRPNGVAENVYYGYVKRLDGGLDSFTDEAPFTLQRICELLLYPPSSYSNIDKFTLAFERLLLVTSTFENSEEPYPEVALPADVQTNFTDAACKTDEFEASIEPNEDCTSNPMDIDVKLSEAKENEVSLERDLEIETESFADIVLIPHAESQVGQDSELNGGGKLAHESSPIVDNALPLVEDPSHRVEDPSHLAEDPATIGENSTTVGDPALAAEEVTYLLDGSAPILEASAPLLEGEKQVDADPADVGNGSRV